MAVLARDVASWRASARASVATAASVASGSATGSARWSLIVRPLADESDPGGRLGAVGFGLAATGAWAVLRALAHAVDGLLNCAMELGDLHVELVAAFRAVLVHDDVLLVPPGCHGFNTMCRFLGFDLHRDLNRFAPVDGLADGVDVPLEHWTS